MFVSKEDIESLTGYVRRKDQIRWLRANGILFKINRRGDPMVLQAEINRVMCSDAADKDEDLNWEALNSL